MSQQPFYSHGKLLITGEYVVLDGALALAIPTKYGQSLELSHHENDSMLWQSFNAQNELWFEAEFKRHDSSVSLASSDMSETAKTLVDILNAAKGLNNDFLSDHRGLHIRTYLEFPQDWGLGSSSTLINNIASWAQVDPYVLLDHTLGGSGYDIACAQHNSPLIYHRTEKTQQVKRVDFHPVFSQQLYFVHLNRKQNSRRAIAQYNDQTIDKNSLISEIDDLTMRLIDSKTLTTFCEVLDKHESLLSSILNVMPVKERLFKDFNGSIKSLGAWGGDFVLVASQYDPVSYFNSKGYHTIIPYNDMIL